MPFRLRDKLHYCFCGGRAVFLDVQADRYFCLPFAAEAAFIRVAAGRMVAGDEDRLHALISRGLLIDDPQSPGLGAPLALTAPSGDLLAEPDPARLSDSMLALVQEARVAWRLRRTPFQNIIEEVAGRAANVAIGADADHRVRRIVSAAASLSPTIRAADRCLVRAIALHALCCRHGIHPKLVFGVRVNPFGAHCWVQLEDKILVGDFEQVRLFTPILAVG